jgi:3-phenylpropionate/trans-cinnamate dioxygenase ferredoxin subunit
MWTFAIKESDLGENRLVRAYPKGIAVLVVKDGGTVHALSSNCPHMGCSLGGAVLDGAVIMCPCHDWRFDAATGRFVDAPEISLYTYPVKTENGNILINLDKEAA